jgi:ornithine cyclodeaminase/alanine dehydrogenase-like protein (mu-crystallin family)
MARILSRSDIQRCLTMPEAINAMRLAFRALHTGQATMPQRTAINLPEQGTMLLMPSLLVTMEQQDFGLKLVAVMQHNPVRNLPLIYASVLLVDATTGRTLAIMEGGWLTAMRTGAVSGLATDLLARPDADVLALFGAGAQAPLQALAIHTVRPLREIRVVNRNVEHFERLVTVLETLLGTACPPIYHATSATEALKGASLVACATTATKPLFSWQDVEPGTHINAIGAFTPVMCEVDAETLAHARIVVDQREAALSEAGDLLQPLVQGLITGPETWLELSDVVVGTHRVRQHANDVTVFKSVGIAIQDVAVASTVYKKALDSGVGVDIEV